MNASPPLKVVHMISGDLWAGAESQAFTLLSQLRRAEGVRLSAIVLNEGRLAAQLRDLSIPVHVVDERRLDPLRILVAVRALLANDGCDILHTHRYKENVIGAFASRMAGRPRLVKTVHGLVEHFFGFRRFKSGFTAVVDRTVTRRYFDRVICVSEDMQGQLRQRYRPEQLACIRNGIDPDRCKPTKSRQLTRDSLGIPQDAPVVGTASRLVGVKGLGYLLEAARSMHSALPELRLLIAGDGPEMAALKAQSAALGLTPFTIFTGHRDDVFDLIAAMDLFALPSLSEGIPMVLLETMAIGTPIVATRVGGIPEIIRDGESGLLVAPRNTAELERACLRILTRDSLAAGLAGHAREVVNTEHSAVSMGRSVLELYRSLLPG